VALCALSTVSFEYINYSFHLPREPRIAPILARLSNIIDRDSSLAYVHDNTARNVTVVRSVN